MTGNASDQMKAGRLLHTHFPRMSFHTMDTTHILQPSIRHRVAGDLEVETLAQILAPLCIAQYFGSFPARPAI